MVRTERREASIAWLRPRVFLTITLMMRDYAGLVKAVAATKTPSMMGICSTLMSAVSARKGVTATRGRIYICAPVFTSRREALGVPY